MKLKANKLVSHKLISLALDLIFPSACFSCRAYLERNEKPHLVCEKCKKSISLLNGFYCAECGKRIPDMNQNFTNHCHSGSFLVYACGQYNDIASRNIIHSLKYSSLKQAIAPITSLLIRPALTNYPLPANSETVLVPIPLFKLKENLRGYNQSELIARAVSETINKNTDFKIPTLKILKRIKNTTSQTEIKNYADRAKNIQNCFSTNTKEANKLKANEAKIVLIDDVFTSGATMTEAVKTLRQNGFKKILGFAVLKT